MFLAIQVLPPQLLQSQIAQHQRQHPSAAEPKMKVEQVARECAMWMESDASDTSWWNKYEKIWEKIQWNQLGGLKTLCHYEIYRFEDIWNRLIKYQIILDISVGLKSPIMD